MRKELCNGGIEHLLPGIQFRSYLTIETMEKESKRGEIRLPHEITTDILSRLPIESIMVCRCVCNAWNSLINDNYFVKLHLFRSNANPASSSHILIGARDTRYLLNAENWNVREIAVYPHVKDKASLKGSMHVSSHLDGLICFYANRYYPAAAGPVVIYNPLITGDHLCLPESTAEERNVSVTLGFDHSINKYKVVKFMTYPQFNNHAYCCEVITVGKDTSWRRLVFPYAESISFIRTGICHQGSIYWVVNENLGDGGCFLEFDLTKEVFSKLSFPNSIKSLTHHGRNIVQLQSLGEYINLIGREGRLVHIWRIVKQNTGSIEVAGYKTIKLESAYAYSAIHSFIYLSNNEDLLIVQTEGGFEPVRNENGKRIRAAAGRHYSIYRPASKEKIPLKNFRNLPSMISVDYNVHMWCFKPSLVSIKKAMLNHL